MKAELVVLDLTCFEVEWLKNLLSSIHLIFFFIPFISLQCDSRDIMNFYKIKLVNFNASRHMKLKQKSVRQLFSHNVTSLSFIRSKQNFVDYLTKGLSKTNILESSSRMRLCPLKIFMQWKPNLCDRRSFEKDSMQ